MRLAMQTLSALGLAACGLMEGDPGANLTGSGGREASWRELVGSSPITHPVPMSPCNSDTCAGTCTEQRSEPAALAHPTATWRTEAPSRAECDQVCSQYGGTCSEKAISRELDLDRLTTKVEPGAGPKWTRAREKTCLEAGCTTCVETSCIIGWCLVECTSARVAKPGADLQELGELCERMQTQQAFYDRCKTVQEEAVYQCEVPAYAAPCQGCELLPGGEYWWRAQGGSQDTEDAPAVCEYHAYPLTEDNADYLEQLRSSSGGGPCLVVEQGGTPYVACPDGKIVMAPEEEAVAYGDVALPYSGYSAWCGSCDLSKNACVIGTTSRYSDNRSARPADLQLRAKSLAKCVPLRDVDVEYLNSLANGRKQHLTWIFQHCSMEEEGNAASGGLRLLQRPGKTCPGFGEGSEGGSADEDCECKPGAAAANDPANRYLEDFVAFGANGCPTGFTVKELLTITAKPPRRACGAGSTSASTPSGGAWISPADQAKVFSGYSAWCSGCDLGSNVCLLGTTSHPTAGVTPRPRDLRARQSSMARCVAKAELTDPYLEKLHGTTPSMSYVFQQCEDGLMLLAAPQSYTAARLGECLPGAAAANDTWGRYLTEFLANECGITSKTMTQQRRDIANLLKLYDDQTTAQGFCPER